MPNQVLAYMLSIKWANSWLWRSLFSISRVIMSLQNILEMSWPNRNQKTAEKHVRTYVYEVTCPIVEPKTPFHTKLWTSEPILVFQLICSAEICNSIFMILYLHKCRNSLTDIKKKKKILLMLLLEKRLSTNIFWRMNRFFILCAELSLWIPFLIATVIQWITQRYLHNVWLLD